MAPRRILVVGNSHSQMLSNALSKHRDFGASEAPDFKFMWLKTQKHGDATLPEIEAEVSGLKETDLLAITILGTQHNILALFRHDQPYRLYDPQHAELFEDSAGEVVPLSTFAAAIRDIVQRDVTVARLKKLAPCRVVHFPPPPPKFSFGSAGKHIKISETETVFREFEDPYKRQLIYKLEQGITDEYLKKIGVDTCEIPKEAVDENGFLSREFQAADATHANFEYGASMLRYLAKL